MVADTRGAQWFCRIAELTSTLVQVARAVVQVVQDAAIRRHRLQLIAHYIRAAIETP